MTPQNWADFIGAMEHTPPSGVPSTGERLLLALALCEPQWLPAMYRDHDHQARWQRLDEARLHGLLLWTQRPGTRPKN